MGRLTAIVLGAAAGGGVPQWNCRCDVCRIAWSGDPRVKSRTQASLAVSADGEHWALVNASPDLRAQIQANPNLHPSSHQLGDKRGSPIAAVILTGGEIDQTAGLLSLRERSPFALHATAATLMAVADNPMFGALAPDVVTRHAIVPGQRFSPVPGIETELFIVPGKVPLYLEGNDPDTASESAANVGVEITCGAARLVYVPGAAAITPTVKERLASADVIMFDGTVLTDDEMIRAGTGSKTGRRMGHMPLDGADGSIAALAGLRARRIFVHINNTNPILIDRSPERLRVEAAGWEVAEDGLKVVL
jgi:pyrroloquinoline quinone biosynthesis protein B